ncbi:PLDc N-terminal domain-containing protein [Jatrophihabitans endophyticus]|uniref:PLDc N-terminal domain-containing protein n=1 Tax=Jatrophihabitans endophyticus TaxID=1206085 RepID=UPI0019D839B2|nr:PLDc N-terminal domain-containing protein [Jatrophihabitans endophyticus]MBE7187937.1 PLDc N-terminal domain-containing protein [Jatrophihabitans endophyticus]
MILFDGFAGVVAFAVWIFCIIDVITTPDERIRNLPKLLWLVIVILLVDIGSIAWLIAGRDWNSNPIAAGHPRTARPPSRPSNPDDDQEFLDGLRRRAEEQRRRAREATDDDPSA